MEAIEETIKRNELPTASEEGSFLKSNGQEDNFKVFRAANHDNRCMGEKKFNDNLKPFKCMYFQSFLV